jgi:hypothetical protein
MLQGAGIFTYIWVMFRVNVGYYSINGAFGNVHGCVENTNHEKNGKIEHDV